LRSLIVKSHDFQLQLAKPEVVRELVFSLPRDLASAVMESMLIEPVHEPYQSANKLRISKNSVHYKRLLAAFGLDFQVSTVPRAKDDLGRIQPVYGLYDHQRSAVRDCWKMIDSGHQRFLVHMPTGSGKTRTAIHFLSEILRREKSGLVIWIANSEELCEQAASEFETAWGAIGNRTLDISRYWGSHSDDGLVIEDGILVAGIQKLHSLLVGDSSKLQNIAANALVVVFDEAHQVTAPTYSAVVEYLLNYKTNLKLVGLSATPGRTWNDIDEDEELSTFFGRSKVTISDPDYDNPVDFLVDNGYLARAVIEPLLYQPGFELTERDLASISSAVDMPDYILRKIGKDRQRNIRIIQKISSLVAEHKRIIVFAPSVEASKLIASALVAIDIDSVSVDGGSPDYLRKSAIQKLRDVDDRPFVLCNYGVATTGVDVPGVSCAVIARPTQSLVLFSQMIGRAIRGPKVGGNSEALIVTVVDYELPGFGNVRESFMNWEDVWN